MGDMPEPTASIARVRTTVEGDRTTVSITGVLDIHAGRALVAAVAEAVQAGRRRLEVELSDISGYDDDGAGALLACRDLGQTLADGLHYRTCSGGPGQEVLLHAYAGD